jgi:hypothetical protein
MRPRGGLTSAAGLVPFGHLAWGYRDRTEFRSRAAEYIADGLARNQRVLYAADGGRDALLDELTEMGFADAIRAGQIWARPVRDHYPLVPGSDVIDPEAAVADGVAALEQLVAAGYSGCRAVVDGAVLVRTPEQRAAFSRLEYLIDQKMAVLPLSALCAYNLELLGDDARELMCLHPFVNADTVSFRIYAQHDHDFALAGEIDAGDHEPFTTALQRIWPLTTGEELVIDAHELSFLTHRELCAMDELGGAEAKPVVLRTDGQMLVRLAELLGLRNIRVDRAPGLLAGAR